MPAASKTFYRVNCRRDVFIFLPLSSPKVWLERSRRIGNQQSFDDLVCPHEDLRRNSYANLSSCSEIDHELEFRRPLYRQVARLSAFKNSIHEVCEAAEHGRIRPIRHKAADLNELPPPVDRRQPVLYRKFHDPFLVGIKEHVSYLYNGAASRPRRLLERASKALRVRTAIE